MRAPWRWAVLFPAVALVVFLSWQVYLIGIVHALSKCPRDLQSMMSISFHHFGLTMSNQFCGASWFPATNRALLASAIGLSVAAAGAVGFLVSPSRKLLSATLSSVFAIAAAAAAFGAP